MADSDRPKTAFCTPFGLFECHQIPFGLCDGPSTFQQLMQLCLVISGDFIVCRAAFDTVEGHLESAGARRFEGEVGEVFVLSERGKVFGAHDLIIENVSRSK